MSVSSSVPLTRRKLGNNADTAIVRVSLLGIYTTWLGSLRLGLCNGMTKYVFIDQITFWAAVLAPLLHVNSAHNILYVQRSAKDYSPEQSMRRACHTDFHIRLLSVIRQDKSSIKMTALWDIVSCSLVEVDRRFRDAYCLQHRGQSHIIIHRSMKLTYIYACLINPLMSYLKENTTL
jgi:hypothetical protein